MATRTRTLNTTWPVLAKRERRNTNLVPLLSVSVALVAIAAVLNITDVRYPMGVGGSMWGNTPQTQTIRDGQRVIYLKPWRPLRTGDVVLTSMPEFGLLAKRIDKLDNSKGVWLEGDSRIESFDSDYFGWVPLERVEGLCLVRLPHMFDGSGEKGEAAKTIIDMEKWKASNEAQAKATAAKISFEVARGLTNPGSPLADLEEETGGRGLRIGNNKIALEGKAIHVEGLINVIATGGTRGEIGVVRQQPPATVKMTAAGVTYMLPVNKPFSQSLSKPATSVTFHIPTGEYGYVAEEVRGYDR